MTDGINLPSLPKGAGAVMASRSTPVSALDAFWTPPWATRALCDFVLCPSGVDPKYLVAWDPACGMGLMSDVLKERFRIVHATDVADYGMGNHKCSFEDSDSWIRSQCIMPDWIITNPPFKLAAEFLVHAMGKANHGVALLCRLQWIESEERYNLFQRFPLTVFAPFSGRVPMVQGRYDPNATTATAYAWFVFMKGERATDQREVIFIPPDAKARLHRTSDVERFAPWMGVRDDPATIEKLARSLCGNDDPDDPVQAQRRDTQTYREARRSSASSGLIRGVKRWQSFRRQADDNFANSLIQARRTGTK